MPLHLSITLTSLALTGSVFEHGTDWHLLAAGIWFLVLTALATMYAVSFLRTEVYTLWEKCLYLPTYLLGRLLWRVCFVNEPPAEITSGALLVANHRSSVDPFFVQLAAGRRVHWMVAKEYCNHALFGPLLRLLQVIPTNRSGMDTAATKAAIRITQDKRLVGMFPEGRINTSTDVLLPIRGGAALVSLRAGVPIIPLWIEGSPYRSPAVWSPIIMPARVRITFGQPIHPTLTTPDTEVPPKTTTPDLPASSSSTAPSSTAEAQADSDRIILSWGQQVASLAGLDCFPVRLARVRARRSTNSNPS
ncbi:MAG: 1-acyl-sn-glycerol-3-phosphate acyltransferase [bacterium]|nr:1-acyl-sn-glycerol-3-phosphate acyltransferase [bacterium]